MKSWLEEFLLVWVNGLVHSDTILYLQKPEETENEATMGFSRFGLLLLLASLAIIAAVHGE